MKTEQIVVSSEGSGIKEALAATEKFGAGAALGKKQVLHLRLLAEELFGMLRGITGKVEAKYWIEAHGNKYEIHLNSEVSMNEEIREKLIAASSSGQNAAEKSFMGKIRVFIADVMLSTKEMLPYAMMNSAAAYSAGGALDDSVAVWTMSEYTNALQKNIDKSPEAREAWDELEKSIVANIADDIKVSIAGKKAEITVYKAF